MAFNATSRVTSWDNESAEPARLGSKEGRRDGGVTGEDGEPVERRSRTVRWSSGTCHVARWGEQASQDGSVKKNGKSETMTLPNEPVPSTSLIS
jgi:hypothetical protein